MPSNSKSARRRGSSGTLRIGDQWNAINIIAQSQTHPLKAICELTENAIDAGAMHVTIVRRRQKGQIFLEVSDDGSGVTLTEAGQPDFQRIATHVCDSMKRHLNSEQRSGIHGEFGIGLLSFWSLGNELRMISGGADGLHEMQLVRGERKYEVRPVRGNLAVGGTRVMVGPLLEATRKIVTGDKVARYLSAELRDRIRKTGVRIRMLDRVSRKDLVVTPREFDGERLELTRKWKTELGDVYVELYFRGESREPGTGIALCKDGTRVLKQISELLQFQHAPWCDNRLEGLLDFDALKLAPGTRSGIVPDAAFDAFVATAKSMEEEILCALEKREQAETDRASKQILKQVHKAFANALRELPQSEYLFFDLPHTGRSLEHHPHVGEGESLNEAGRRAEDHQETESAPPTPEFLPFEPGTLHSVRISPRKLRRRPGETATLRAVASDERGATLTEGIHFHWRILDGDARMTGSDTQTCEVLSSVIGVVRVEVTATINQTQATSEGEVKFLEYLGADENDLGGKGLPSYRLEAEYGESWRSRYDAKPNEIVINSAHRDFLASKQTLAKHRRYIGKLYAKEVVLINFPHESPANVMERLIEITLRTEDVL